MLVSVHPIIRIALSMRVVSSPRIRRCVADNSYLPFAHSVEAGWIGRQAILMTGINSVIYVLSTIPTFVLSHHRNAL